MNMRDPSGIVWDVSPIGGGWRRLTSGSLNPLFAPPTTDLGALGFTVMP